MKTVRLFGPGDIRLQDEPEPIPVSGEALLQVASVGICGSDLTWFTSSGIGSAKLDRPLILGHEFSAVALTGRFTGKRVAVDPAIPCNRCRYCLEGNPNFCEATHFAGHAPDDGALRELMTWPEELLHPLPDELSFEDGVMLEPPRRGHPRHEPRQNPRGRQRGRLRLRPPSACSWYNWRQPPAPRGCWPRTPWPIAGHLPPPSAPCRVPLGTVQRSPPSWSRISKAV